jgi:glutathione S-transferase
MRRWSQIVDEHLFHAIATIGWAFGIGPILRERGRDEFEKSLARISLHSKRQKWLKAYHGFPQGDIDEARAKIRYAVARMEQTLAEHTYLAGPTYSLADINVLSSAERMPRWARRQGDLFGVGGGAATLHRGARGAGGGDAESKLMANS